ncbi:glutamate ligase domain-containing protein, partial [Thermodesulfobacteriota bacterium]
PKDMRSESIQLNNNVVLINDAYNANPDSMTESLVLFKSLSASNRRIAVLGDMNELGRYSERAHKEVGAIVANLGFDSVFFYGEEMKHAAKNASFCGMDKSKIHWLNNIDSLFEELNATLKDGDWILLKGSRLNKLEQVAKRLKDTIGTNNLKMN